MAFENTQLGFVAVPMTAINETENCIHTYSIVDSNNGKSMAFCDLRSLQLILVESHSSVVFKTL